MKIGVLKETYPGEQRVALVPAVLPSLIKGGMEVLIESKAGEANNRDIWILPMLIKGAQSQTPVITSSNYQISSSKFACWEQILLKAKRI